MGDPEQPARETRREVSNGGRAADPTDQPATPPTDTRRDPPSAVSAAPPPGGPTPPGGVSPADVLSPAETRRDSAPRATMPLVRLPGTLAERFSIIGELPAQGAESDLLHVRDAAGAELVIKIFRAGFSADRQVWRELPGLDAEHVVRIHETGHADGRDYEVMEYVAGGNLRALIPPERPALSPGLVTEIIAQLAAGLRGLHRAGIVHRDLKPENVLVRSPIPVSLAITDFGLSKVIDQSVVFASSSRTLAYAAPESLSGQVSPARDWWSLGLIARELATGRPPFGGLSEAAVVDHLATRPVDVDDIADTRLRLLCRGLLVRDPRRRWGADEVDAWLAGDTPPVPEDTGHPTAPAPPAVPTTSQTSSRAEGLPFAGHRYTERRELARALVEHWPEAARFFFAAMHTPSGPSEAWRTLREWLGQFDSDAEGRIELIDSRLSGEASPDVKVLHLVRWLDPDLPPHYLGRRLLTDDLAGLAGIAGQSDHADHATAVRIGRHLREHQLLPVLAGFSSGYELTEIDERWQGLIAAWNRHAGTLRPQLAGTGARLPDAGAPGQDEPPTVLLMLLAVAARPAETTHELAAAARAAREAVHGPVPWFDRLADQAGDDAVRLLAVITTAPAAVAEAETATRHREAAARQSAAQRLRWREREQQRLAGRTAAVGRALLWSLPLLVLWFGGTWLILQLSRGVSGQQISGVATSINAAPGLILCAFAWVIQVACEIFLARRQGTDYLRTGPWPMLARGLNRTRRGLAGISSAVSRPARGSTGVRSCGCLAAIVFLPLLMFIAVTAVFLALAWTIWLGVLVVVPLAHVIVTGIRLHRWRQAHDRAAQEAIKEPVSDQ